MPILSLDFGDELLQDLTVCACACRAGSPLAANWLDGGDIYLMAKNTVDGTPAFVRLIIEKSGDDHIHFHIDVSKNEIESWRREFQMADFHALLELAEGLRGCQVDASIMARYLVPLDSLPKRGILSALLGISTVACGAEMCLSGATMDIKQSDIFTRVKWEISEDNKNAVLVKIEGDSESTVDETYLDKFARLMREGLDCFVFESSGEKVEHADQASSPLPSKKLGTG